MSMDFRLYDDEAISIHMVKLIHGKFLHRLFYDRTPRELWGDRKADELIKTSAGADGNLRF